MSGGNQFRTLRERVDRVEATLLDGQFAATLQHIVLLTEMVAELAGRLAAVDGGQNADAMYAAALARRAAAAVQATPQEGETVQ